MPATLEDENARLKRLVADLTLDKHMLDGGPPAKDSMKPAQRRELAGWFHVTFQIGVRRACGPVFLQLHWHGLVSRPSEAAECKRSCGCGFASSPTPGRGSVTCGSGCLSAPGGMAREPRSGCVGSIASKDCSSGCGFVGASTSPSIAGRRRRQRARPSAGAWTSCTTRWPTGARFACSPSSISGVARVRS